jgi:hypothetical protein
MVQQDSSHRDDLEKLMELAARILEETVSMRRELGLIAHKYDHRGPAV